MTFTWRQANDVRGPDGTGSWVVLVTLATPGERSHFFVVPRNHATAAMHAYAGGRPDQGEGWRRKLFGEGDFAGYDEAWEDMTTSAAQAPWRMHEWVAYELGSQGRNDVFAAIPAMPRL